MAAAPVRALFVHGTAQIFNVFFLSFQLAVDPLGLVRSVRFLCRCVFTEFCFRVVPSLGHGRSFSFFGRPENCTGGRRTKKNKKKQEKRQPMATRVAIFVEPNRY